MTQHAKADLSMTLPLKKSTSRNIMSQQSAQVMNDKKKAHNESIRLYGEYMNKYKFYQNAKRLN